MGFQVVEPTAGSTDWTNFSTIVNDMMQGFMALSLTNYDTTDVPLIAAGGKVEVAGSLYIFASTEAITGSLSTNQNYIMLTTSSSSITVSYTSDAPTWVPSKHGWYDSSTGVQRYIGGLSTDNDGKWVYETGQQDRSNHTIIEQSTAKNILKIKVFEIGGWNMDAVGTIAIPHTLNRANIRSISAIIQNDLETVSYDFAGTIRSPASEEVDTFILSDATAFQILRGADDLRFNTTGFNSTSINRGWITCWYEI